MRPKNNVVHILRDCDGKVDVDQYFEEEDVPKLKTFLESIGVKTVVVQDSEESLQTGKPFRYHKPSIQKKMTKEVDWENPQVVETVLTSKYDDESILQEIVQISGRVVPEASEATTFTVIARFRHIWREYEQWRRVVGVVIAPENEVSSRRKLAQYYVELIKMLRQKRVPIGAKVFLHQQNKYGTVIEYGDDGYTIADTDGFRWRCNRKEFEVIRDEK